MSIDALRWALGTAGDRILCVRTLGGVFYRGKPSIQLNLLCLEDGETIYMIDIASIIVVNGEVGK